MQIKTIKIGKSGVELTAYIQDIFPSDPSTARRPAVLVFPGGGYEFCSEREAEPLAMAYAAQGFQTFVLIYSIKENGHYPLPQRDAFEAIAYIRKNAEAFRIDPKRVAVVGFSAGGHLAASTAVHWKTPDCIEGKEPTLCRPDATVLVYPVITAGAYAWDGMLPNHVKGGDPNVVSLETQVNDDTPPAFICHTAEDTCVPAMNSLLYASELAKRKIPFELHVYQQGWHGLSLANQAVIGNIRNYTPEQRNFLAAFSEWFMKSVAFLYRVLGENDCA